MIAPRITAHRAIAALQCEAPMRHRIMFGDLSSRDAWPMRLRLEGRRVSQAREFSGSKGWTIDYFPPGGGQIKVHLP